MKKGYVTTVILAMIVIVVPQGLAAQTVRASNCATYIDEASIQESSFVLVIDRSGSMISDNAMNLTIEAVISFVQRMRPGDRAAVVSFANDVTIDQVFTTDKQRLIQAARRLRASGATRLNDAIAAGARLLSEQRGTRVLIVFTDGIENRSTLRERDILQMNIGENTLTYTLGLGQVDHTTLERFATSTGGIYEYARSARDVDNVYQRVQSHFYERRDVQMRDTGGITIQSIPAGRTVLLGGEDVGPTPLRLNDLDAGTQRVEVLFDRGSWICDLAIISGQRAFLSARERDVPLSLVIETAPTRAAVFIDDDYVGMSSLAPSIVGDGRRDISNQLIVSSLAPGTYRVRVVAAPELDFSPNQVMEFDVTISNRQEYVKALIFMNMLEDREGNRERIGAPGGSPGGFSPDSIRDRVFGGSR